MKTENKRFKVAAYLFLLAVQILGSLAFVWQELPAFMWVVADPGEQLPYDIVGDLFIMFILIVMQISFWCRQLYFPIPFRHPNMVLNHVLLFVARLSFIFGSALFSVAVFRHLPKLGTGVDVILAVKRGAILVACLFALFCASLEVERLGRAFEDNRN